MVFYLWASSAVWKVSWCCCQKKQTFLLEPACSFLHATFILVPTQCVNSRESNWIGKVIWLKWLSHTCTTEQQFSTECSLFLFNGGLHVWVVTWRRRLLLVAAVPANWFKRLFNYIIRLQRTQRSEMSILILHYSIMKEYPYFRRGAQKWVWTFCARQTCCVIVLLLQGQLYLVDWQVRLSHISLAGFIFHII